MRLCRTDSNVHSVLNYGVKRVGEPSRLGGGGTNGMRGNTLAGSMSLRCA